MVEPVEVSVEIAAAPSALYAMVSDVTRMHEWSPENVACTWVGGATGPAVGARFTGRNRRGSRRWSSANEVVEAEPGAAFAFRTRAAGLAVSLWRYTFAGDENAGTSTVTESWTDERGTLITVLGRLATGVADREAHNRDGMRQTLEALKATAEAG